MQKKLKKRIMKKKLFLNSFLLSIYSLVCHAQGFQKSYGKADNDGLSDQQELYNMCNNDSESLLACGVFKNISTFPEIAVYGTVSKMNKNGTVNWYKGYLPTDFIPFESFLISSIFKRENGETYCLGSYLSMEARTGYILMKLDAEGEVVFAKKIRDEEIDLYPKAVLKDGFIYASLFDKIVKFNLDGEIVQAKKFEHLSFRDMNLDQNNNLILTGEYVNTNPDVELNLACQIITLDGNLQLVSGNLYTTDPFQTGSMYGQSIIATEGNKIIVGGPSGVYFCANPDGQVAWANMIPQFSSPIPADGYGPFWDLQSSSDGMIVGVLDAFFSNNDGVVVGPTEEGEEYFQHYSAFCKIDPATGSVISKDLKAGHFTGINHISLNNIVIDNDVIYSGGKILDDYPLYKLNYIHKTGIDALGCGEAARSYTIESWQDQILPVVPYPASSITPVTELLISDVEMFSVPIPMNYENLSCREVLGVDETVMNNVISIHPNPVDDTLNISTTISIAGIRVFDVLGKEFKVQNLSENSYDFSTLSSGIYLIQVKDTQNNIITQKVIKK